MEKITNLVIHMVNAKNKAVRYRQEELTYNLTCQSLKSQNKNIERSGLLGTLDHIKIQRKRKKAFQNEQKYREYLNTIGEFLRLVDYSLAEFEPFLEQMTFQEVNNTPSAAILKFMVNLAQSNLEITIRKDKLLKDTTLEEMICHVNHNFDVKMVAETVLGKEQYKLKMIQKYPLCEDKGDEVFYHETLNNETDFVTTKIPMEFIEVNHLPQKIYYFINHETDILEKYQETREYYRKPNRQVVKSYK